MDFITKFFSNFFMEFFMEFFWNFFLEFFFEFIWIFYEIFFEFFMKRDYYHSLVFYIIPCELDGDVYPTIFSLKLNKET